MSFAGALPIDMWVEIAGWAPDAQTWASVRATHPRIAERLDPGEAKKRYARLVDASMKEDPFSDFVLFGEVLLPLAWLHGFPPDSRARFWRLPNGALHGRCELITYTKSVYAEGAFVDGMPDGLWVVHRGPHSDEERGIFERGVRTGRWCWWDEEGDILMKGEYRNGARVGHWYERNSKTGVATQGAFANGQKQGPWVEIDPEGRLLAVTEYRDSKAHGGAQLFDAHGHVRSVKSFCRGSKDGKEISYGKNGWPRCECTYIDGGLQETIDYDSDGLVLRRVALEGCTMVSENFPLKRHRESGGIAENESKRRCMEGP